MQRMKSNYEDRFRFQLLRRIPVIIRIDGKAFHTYTAGLEKPYDEGLRKDMADTAMFLCRNIQGAKLAYTQSDEISLLITDFDDLETQAWFDNNLQKIVSVSASLATAKFNELRNIRYGFENNKHLAFFDARAFNLPKEEVSNYFLARQKDAVKNSIALLGQSLYSTAELKNKNSNEVQEMCFQKGINWNDFDYSVKRGVTIMKVDGQWTFVETPLTFDYSFFKPFLNE